MRLTLATLPLHAVDLDGRLTLRHGSDDAPGTRVAVLGLDADALLAAAPHLGATLTLMLCDGAPAPGPSRDELAARLDEAERELADVTRRADALGHANATNRDRADALDAAIRAAAVGCDVLDDERIGGPALVALRALAARVDREPPQRAPGLGAGVADAGVWRLFDDLLAAIEADARDCDYMADSYRNETLSTGATVSGAYETCAADSRAIAKRFRAAALARQDVRSADRGADAVEPRERVGSAVERVVVTEGVARDFDGDAIVGGLRAVGLIATGIAAAVRKHDGRRVRVVVEVLAEVSDVHTDSVAPSSPSVESPR